MTTQLERRNLSGVQVRAAADAAFTLEGVAASYNMPSKILVEHGLRFTEYIAPGAFTRSLRNKVDVKALFNHNVNLVLGRVRNGTLTLTDTGTGLAFRCQLNPAMQAHKDLYASVQRGDISECSFGFVVPKGGDKWSDDYSKRTLLEVDLFDVSVVTNPAYGDGATTVDARQLRSAQYVASQDWRAKHMAALAKLERQIASDKFDTILEETKQAIDEARGKL